MTLDPARMEAILRDHAMHEPECPVRRAQKHNAKGGTYMTPGECDCWLSEPE
jgi:hypothetical protein